MNQSLIENLKKPATWQRILYMLLFAIAFSLGKTLLFGIVLVQVGFVLLAGAPNEPLRGFSVQLSRYLYEILRYLSFEIDRQPFPFSPWDEYAD